MLCPLEWTLLLLHVCGCLYVLSLSLSLSLALALSVCVHVCVHVCISPTLGREPLAPISESGPTVTAAGGGGGGGGGRSGSTTISGAAVYLQQNQAAQLKRQRTVGYAPYGGSQQARHSEKS